MSRVGDLSPEGVTVGTLGNTERRPAQNGLTTADLMILALLQLGGELSAIFSHSGTLTPTRTR